MSRHRDFDALVFAYLDGDATADQVVALRDALRADPALRARLAALVRLHRAQSVVLGRASRAPLAGALAGLRQFADRAGRFLAHACVLALVCVELDVSVPGVDTHAWLDPEPASVAVEDAGDTEPSDMTADMSPVPDDEDSAMPDVREADFLES